ncbi:sensor histidine kinase [Streptomyces sp. WAC05374]|uniref:sensor histidine kinase n=1 Tax=Streptomyces sp. WAC05374 TaxID=2487420 RepID=UPI000F8890F5|nr:sensor histidine kinase [Streptomyces sp. WAC05374]RST19232.1 sensor histidine kinase [Streptomyces sp. WAC05374]TDF50436.1 sensor histidine kinase [Streptomyces sp. WAC05374]TDF51803.1 sensor histidine kinase [Streptomyces sp. WAC05374]TDF60689.1 sensor histidine kinase [Streptomyces sp. WAC05374]
MPRPQTTRGIPRTGPAALPAYLVCVVAMLSGFAWLTVGVVHADHPVLDNINRHFSAIAVVLALGLALSGMAFIVRGRAGRALGWLLLCAGAVFAGGATLSLTAALLGAGPAIATLVLLIDVTGYALFGVVVYTLPLWLPDGRSPRGWARAYVAALTLWSFAQQFYEFTKLDAWYMDNPLAEGAWARLGDWAEPVMGPAIDWVPPLAAGAALVVLAVRWHRTPPGGRGNYVLALPYVLWLAVMYFGAYADTPQPVVFVVQYVGAAVWPAALAFIDLRERAWHLDRAARRILTALLLTFVLFLLYFAGGLLLWNLGPRRLDGSLMLSVTVALVIGALLRPTAHWASRVVDRYYYGARAQPYQVVRDLADRLSSAPDPGDAPRLLCATVVHTLGLSAAALTVNTHHGPRELVALGEPGPAGERFPLSHRGEEIGCLTVPPRPGELALDPQDREAVRVLADHAAPAIASLRLYEDLQSSREQIIVAREEERRRLRHDLHDGLGPALSGLRLQVDAVRATARPEVADPLLAVSEGIGSAIRELRHITDGLAPAALDGADLSRALRRLAEHLSSRTLNISVTVRPDPLPRLSAALEVAVYRITAEALNNAVRHSHADHAHALVAVADGTVTVQVRDNGDGFPDDQRHAGVGLRSMAERSDELGGRFTLTSSADGTVVRAVFPSRPASAPPAGHGAPVPSGTATGHRSHAPETRDRPDS